MARKPQAGLPDVFAKPGQAPERNTAIEDLPRQAKSGPPPDAASAVPPGVPPAAAAPALGAAAPAAAAPPPAVKPASPLRPAPPRPAPPPVSPPALKSPPPPSRPATSHSAARGVAQLAGVAVVVALLAPLIEGDLLGTIGITTPTFSAQRETALALSRQEQKLRDMEQRLNEAVAQLTAAGAELQQSALRSSDGLAWGRLLALGRVADALRGPTPFAADLAIAQSAGAGLDEFQADLAKLGAYGNTGVPGFAELSREFHRIAEEKSASGPRHPARWAGPPADRAEPVDLQRPPARRSDAGAGAVRHRPAQ